MLWKAQKCNAVLMHFLRKNVWTHYSIIWAKFTTAISSFTHQKLMKTKGVCLLTDTIDTVLYQGPYLWRQVSRKGHRGFPFTFLESELQLQTLWRFQLLFPIIRSLGKCNFWSVSSLCIMYTHNWKFLSFSLVSIKLTNNKHRKPWRYCNLMENTVEDTDIGTLWKNLLLRKIHRKI